MEVPVSQIMDAMEALQVEVHAISIEIHTSLLPQLQEEIVKVAQLISLECIQECVVEQPVEGADAVQEPSPPEHIQERIVQQGRISQCFQSLMISWQLFIRRAIKNESRCRVDISVPPLMEEIGAVVQE